MRKECRIDFRCTEDEFFAINSAAKDCGLTKSDYVRKVVLGFRPWKRLSEGTPFASGYKESNCGSTAYP